MQEKIRYAYIDNMKFAACILVALGHFFMSMTANKVMPYSFAYNYLIKTLYTFHVPIFFVCSGFLYQNSCRVTSFSAYKKELPKKLLDLGVPYFVFSAITLLLKILFENDVTTKATAFWDTLFIHPTAPYWFLYSLFFMFLFIPCIKSKKAAYILFFVSLVFKIGVLLISDKLTVPITNGVILFIALRLEKFCHSAIWFCFGMLLRFIDKEKIKKYGKFLAPVFLAVGIALSFYFLSGKSDMSQGEDFITGAAFILFTVTISIVFAPEALNRISLKFSEFFMPVFVMHTICAAAIRISLFKIGIESLPIHILGGLIGSFAVPIIIYIICKKLTPLMFFFYPTKTIKLLKGKKHEQGEISL